MFGFLSAPCGCLSKNDRSEYRKYFCGLCNCLRSNYGLPTRFLVNRDSTFVSVLCAAQTPSTPSPSLTTCCNPLAKPKELYQHDIHAHFAAAITLCGLGAKVQDHCEDHSGPSKWAGTSMRSALAPSVKKATDWLDQHRFPTHDVSQLLARQSQIERTGENDLDQLAESTAFAFGHIFSHTGQLAEATDNVVPLQTSGHAFGRLVYWLDAVQDREQDARKKQFNPLLQAPDNQQRLPEKIAAELARCEAAFKQSAFAHHADLLSTILVQGVQLKSHQLLNAAGIEPAHSAPLRFSSQKEQAKKKKKRKSKRNDNTDSCCECCNPFNWCGYGSSRGCDCGDCCDCGDGCNCCDCG